MTLFEGEDWVAKHVEIEELSKDFRSTCEDWKVIHPGEYPRFLFDPPQEQSPKHFFLVTDGNPSEPTSLFWNQILERFNDETSSDIIININYIPLKRWISSIDENVLPFEFLLTQIKSSVKRNMFVADVARKFSLYQHKLRENIESWIFHMILSEKIDAQLEITSNDRKNWFNHLCLAFIPHPQYYSSIGKFAKILKEVSQIKEEKGMFRQLIGFFRGPTPRLPDNFFHFSSMLLEQGWLIGNPLADSLRRSVQQRYREIAGPDVIISTDFSPQTSSSTTATSFNDIFGDSASTLLEEGSYREDCPAWFHTHPEVRWNITLCDCIDQKACFKQNHNICSLLSCQCDEADPICVRKLIQKKVLKQRQSEMFDDIIDRLNTFSGNEIAIVEYVLEQDDPSVWRLLIKHHFEIMEKYASSFQPFLLEQIGRLSPWNEIYLSLFPPSIDPTIE
jgi:hypothetical protein